MLIVLQKNLTSEYITLAIQVLQSNCNTAKLSDDNVDDYYDDDEEEEDDEDEDDDDEDGRYAFLPYNCFVDAMA